MFGSRITRISRSHSTPSSPLRSFFTLRDESTPSSPASHDGNQADTEFDDEMEPISEDTSKGHDSPKAVPRDSIMTTPEQQSRTLRVPPAPSGRARSHNVESVFLTRPSEFGLRTLSTARPLFASPAASSQVAVFRDETEPGGDDTEMSLISGFEALQPAFELVHSSMAGMAIRAERMSPDAVPRRQPVSNDGSTTWTATASATPDVCAIELDYETETAGGMATPGDRSTGYAPHGQGYETPVHPPVLESDAVYNLDIKRKLKRKVPSGFDDTEESHIQAVGESQEADLSRSHMGIGGQLYPRSSVVPADEHGGSICDTPTRPIISRSVRPKLGRAKRYFGLGASHHGGTSQVQIEVDEPTSEHDIVTDS